jgi:hypothetical protein
MVDGKMGRTMPGDAVPRSPVTTPLPSADAGNTFTLDVATRASLRSLAGKAGDGDNA